MRYDALLLASFGGPEGPDDVVPFLANVTRGRGIPRERLAEVGAHYACSAACPRSTLRTGRCWPRCERTCPPTGSTCRSTGATATGRPYFAEALAQMRDDGVRRALVIVTSAYSSWSGCRQYRENLAAARAEVGRGGPRAGQGPRLLRPPGIRGAVHPLHARGPRRVAARLRETRHASSSPRTRCPWRWRSPADRRAAGPLRARTSPSTRPWPRSCRRGRRRRRGASPPVRPRLPVALGPAAGAVA